MLDLKCFAISLYLSVVMMKCINADIRFFRDKYNRSVFLGLLVVCAFFGVIYTPLYACAMSAMITRQGYSLNDFPNQGDIAEYWNYNDPWDYFGFVMANSTPDSNSDGYGVVSYSSGTSWLPNRNMWYKRVTQNADFGNMYYTGHYLEAGHLNAYWDYDFFDTAMARIRNSTERPAIVLCHVRNASGITFGTHPFLFNWRNKTYSFMHNGNCNSARSFMINRINEMNPQTNWFELHPNDYFANTDPWSWVDSEVMFHYLLNHIIANQEDVIAGLNSALSELRPFFTGTYSGVYNFILSDGRGLYAFRNTPQSGSNSHYRLSYKNIGDHFYAIRTQAPYAGDTELRALELVAFQRNQKPLHFPEITRTPGYRQNTGAAMLFSNAISECILPSLNISPNPLTHSNSDLSLKFSFPEQATPHNAIVSIYNLKGQRVLVQEVLLTQGLQKLIISLPQLSSGIYLCRIKSGSKVALARFSIIN